MNMLKMKKEEENKIYLEEYRKRAILRWPQMNLLHVNLYTGISIAMVRGRREVLHNGQLHPLLIVDLHYPLERENQTDSGSERKPGTRPLSSFYVVVENGGMRA